MIQAYVDDSGVKGTDPVFVLAGFIASAEEWAAFSSAWDIQLKADPPIRYLKMNEAARSTPSGQFFGWSAEAIQKKLRFLVGVIKAHAKRAIYVAIDLEAHTRLHRNGPTRDAYFLAFYSILSGVCFDRLDSGTAEQIEVIFDQQVIFGPRVALWYPVIQETLAQSLNDDQREMARVLPPGPIFRDDEYFLPLQASDVLAWLFRQALSGNRNEFEWITEELMRSIPMSPYGSVFTEERMRSQMDMANEIVYPEEVLKKWRGILTMRPDKPRKGTKDGEKN